MSDQAYSTPDDCYYSESDEWIRPDGDVVRIGITDFAQSELTDIVFIELPEVGAELAVGDSFGIVESVKAVSDLYAPLAGTVVAVNSELEERPELLNEDPYGEAWILTLQPDDPGAVDGLMSPEQYQKFVQERAES